MADGAIKSCWIADASSINTGDEGKRDDHDLSGGEG
jgi:hypothetical protein